MLSTLLEGFPGGSTVQNLPVIQEMLVGFLGQEDPWKRKMATHCMGWRVRCNLGLSNNPTKVPYIQYFTYFS